MTDAPVQILGSLAQGVVTAWTVAGLVLSFSRLLRPAAGRFNDPRRRFLVAIWAELRPFYLPAVGVVITRLVLAGEMRGWNIFFEACALANWWFFKDVDDDDRWKRRKAKLVAMVQRQGSRLVVVPGGGSMSYDYGFRAGR